MNNQLNYIWIRAILILKEYDGQFQWINGHYSNKKNITFKVENFAPGDYFLVIMPEWRENHNREISIIF